MKRDDLLVLVVMILAGGWFSLSWGQCPEQPYDLGVCDTMNVICVDCNQPDTGAFYFIRFPILVTHDVSNPSIDSVAGFAIPLCYTRTNPTNYCSLSSFWNRTSFAGATLPRSIFRHLVIGTDTVHNWMLDLYEVDPSYVWANIILNLDGISHFWLVLIPTAQPLFGEGDRTLMATMTFRIQDTMHVCIDSCFWPPNTSLAYARPDGRTWVPRSNLPYCFWIGPPQIRVTSPNGGEVWIVGETHDITWLSENFSGTDVKIEYSTNSGASWLPVVASTPNTGSYSWIIPATASPNCRVRVSDLDDDPSDMSDGDFSIIQTPYFELDVMPDTQWIKQGDTTSYEAVLTSFYGFSSPCTLTVSGIPPLATYQFDPWVVTPTDTSTLTIVADSLTPLGSYVLTIIATEKAKLVADTAQVLLYVLSAINRKPQIIVPGPQTTYGGLQLTFAVIATDADTLDTLTLTKSGVGDFPCYPRVSPVVCYFQWTTEPEDTLNSPYTVTFVVDDGRDSTDTGAVEITVLPYNVNPSKRPGDVNGDSVIDISDVVFIIRYLYLDGPPPNPPSAGDMNGDCFVGLSDIIWLINYLYRFGPPPQIRCLPGDFNYDGFVDMLDPPYFIDYMAFGGPPPVSMKSTDVNADCFINPVDLVYEIKYLLRGGQAPQPGCVEPKVGVSMEKPPGVAEVGFFKAKYDLVSRTNQMPVYAKFDKEVAGVELVVTFDPDLVSLLPPTRSTRTENLELFYNLQRGKLVVALVDIEGAYVIQPGEGPILNLNFVSKDSNLSGLSSIQIEKATFVDLKAQEFTEKVVR